MSVVVDNGLGDLYDRLHAMTRRRKVLEASQYAEFSHLCDQYGGDTVKWMMQVLQDDLHTGALNK